MNAELKLPAPTPFWAAIDILAKTFFEAITNSVIIATLMIAEKKFSLHGLQLIIWIGVFFLFSSVYTRSWQLSETLRRGKTTRNHYLVTFVFSAMGSVITVAMLASMVAAAHEIIKG